ncbi:MAG: protein kinase domain-containing protein [Endozoicomonas sp.]
MPQLFAVHDVQIASDGVDDTGRKPGGSASGRTGAKIVTRALDVMPKLLDETASRLTLETGAREKVGEGAYGQVYKLKPDEQAMLQLDRSCLSQPKLEPFYVVKKQTPKKDESGDDFKQKVVQEYDLQAECAAAPALKEQRFVTAEGTIAHEALMEHVGQPLSMAIKVVKEASDKKALPVLPMTFAEFVRVEDPNNRSDPLLLEVVRCLSRQLLESLVELHEKGIVHRDIKSANMMLNSAGKLTLIDFGLSDRASGVMNKFSKKAGTPYHMAPQLFMGKPYSVKADIWSVAVLMVQLLAGFKPILFDHEGRKREDFTFNLLRYDLFMDWLINSSGFDLKTTNLLIRMFAIDEEVRFSAKKALKSDFFPS